MTAIQQIPRTLKGQLAWHMQWPASNWQKMKTDLLTLTSDLHIHALACIHLYSHTDVYTLLHYHLNLPPLTHTDTQISKKKINERERDVQALSLHTGHSDMERVSSSMRTTLSTLFHREARLARSSEKSTLLRREYAERLWKYTVVSSLPKPYVRKPEPACVRAFPKNKGVMLSGELANQSTAVPPWKRQSHSAFHVPMISALNSQYTKTPT